MKEIKNKKGFSPLIATGLLFAFGIGLVIMLINWRGSIQVEVDNKCANTILVLDRVNNFDACLNSAKDNPEISFFLRNPGNTEIESITLYVEGEVDSAIYKLPNSDIKKNSYLSYKAQSVPYSYNEKGNIKRLYIIPQISIENSRQLCFDSFITLSNIGSC